LAITAFRSTEELTRYGKEVRSAWDFAKL